MCYVDWLLAGSGWILPAAIQHNALYQLLFIRVELIFLMMSSKPARNM